jgi:hypothetical protein
MERYGQYRDRANVTIRRAAFSFMSDAQAQMATLRGGDIDGVTAFGAFGRSTCSADPASRSRLATPRNPDDRRDEQRQGAVQRRARAPRDGA